MYRMYDVFRMRFLKQNCFYWRRQTDSYAKILYVKMGTARKKLKKENHLKLILIIMVIMVINETVQNQKKVKRFLYD